MSLSGFKYISFGVQECLFRGSSMSLLEFKLYDYTPFCPHSHWRIARSNELHVS